MFVKFMLILSVYSKKNANMVFYNKITKIKMGGLSDESTESSRTNR